jgi:hypothetical protein
LFGPAAGGTVGKIGHIRAVWTEEPGIVLVRKGRNNQNTLNDSVVWLWDDTGLHDKSGNLVSGDWWGTGYNISAMSNYDADWDNVGFSAFDVPLR